MDLRTTYPRGKPPRGNPVGRQRTGATIFPLEGFSSGSPRDWPMLSTPDECGFAGTDVGINPEPPATFGGVRIIFSVCFPLTKAGVRPQHFRSKAHPHLAAPTSLPIISKAYSRRLRVSYWTLGVEPSLARASSRTTCLAPSSRPQRSPRPPRPPPRAGGPGTFHKALRLPRHLAVKNWLTPCFGPLAWRLA